MVASEETITLRELAGILRRSLPSMHRDDAVGRIPSGFRLGRSRRWLRSEILDWMRAGCPDRRSWEASKQQNRRA
jgi:predicted DNA-binding transcriptional regulator AlpA